MRLRRVVPLLLLLVSLAIPSLALAWPHGTLGQLVYSGSQVPMTTPDASGGVWVGFSTFSGSSYDIYLQHYDRDGNALLGAGGMLVCNAADTQQMEAIGSDGVGGVILAWLDYRAGGYTQQDYYAQRVTAAGTIAWAANGVPVVAATGAASQLRMSVDAGYAFFTWNDNRNSAVTGADIYAQCILIGTGAAQMTANGVVVCNATGDQNYPDVAADEYGTARIVWSDLRGANTDIYVQRITYNGTVTGTANGVVVCNAAGYQYVPLVRYTGGAKFYVAWGDVRSGDYDVYAQLIDGYGLSSYWTANGVAVGSGSGMQYLESATVDVGGNLVVSWADTRRGTQVEDTYLQKVDLTGASLWTANGMPVRFLAGYASNSTVVAAPSGGVFVAWADQRSDAGDVYIQRVSATGAVQWTANGVAIGSGEYQQGFPFLSANPEGGVFCAWADYRSAGTGARVQLVDEWGMTGANPIIAGVKDVPNDQGSQVKVSWYGSPLDTDPLYRSITDYIVYRSVPAATAAKAAGSRFVRTRYAAQDYFWEELAHVVPRHLAQYSYVAATEGDSMAGSNRKTAFMVMATANSGAAWWVTKADSGYSVDNVPPAAPAPLTGQYAASGTALHWNPNTEPDLAGYRVYRGSSASFTPSPATFVSQVPDTGYVASGSAPYFYKLTAIDIHGNESPVATLMPAGTLGVGDGVALRAEFAAPAPNPLRGDRGTTLRFALAVGGRTKLAIYDAQGRMVRTLVDGAREAGAHAIAFDGRDAGGRLLAPGLYLARISAPGLNTTRRLVVVE